MQTREPEPELWSRPGDAGRNPSSWSQGQSCIELHDVPPTHREDGGKRNGEQSKMIWILSI